MKIRDDAGTAKFEEDLQNNQTQLKKRNPIYRYFIFPFYLVRKLKFIKLG